jgi:phosphatidylserine/phosphatidylglycerophosphate/cardiolipin synthase-like enzyme
VIAVLPHLPDQSAPLSRVPQELGRHEAVTRLREAGQSRVAIYGIENHQGLPVYVHAKVCVIDDWWATIGSDNFNRRSWTHDSELSAVVLDTSAADHSVYARRLRLALAAEHLDRRIGPADDESLLDVMADCIDPVGMFDAFASAADALQQWHDAGRSGVRPAGRLRRLREVHLSPVTRAWARPLYRAIHDPDGRPRALRRRHEF